MIADKKSTEKIITKVLKEFKQGMRKGYGKVYTEYVVIDLLKKAVRLAVEQERKEKEELLKFIKHMEDDTFVRMSPEMKEEFKQFIKNRSLLSEKKRC